MVTLWSFKETRIIARCQGHRSWVSNTNKLVSSYIMLKKINQVTGVAFDPLHCDEKDYRFASVGEDCKLLLWDFSVHALHKPSKQVNAAPNFRKKLLQMLVTNNL